MTFVSVTTKIPTWWFLTAGPTTLYFSYPGTPGAAEIKLGSEEDTAGFILAPAGDEAELGRWSVSVDKGTSSSLTFNFNFTLALALALTLTFTLGKRIASLIVTDRRVAFRHFRKDCGTMPHHATPRHATATPRHRHATATPPPRQARTNQTPCLTLADLASSGITTIENMESIRADQIQGVKLISSPYVIERFYFGLLLLIVGIVVLATKEEGGEGGSSSATTNSALAPSSAPSPESASRRLDGEEEDSSRDSISYALMAIGVLIAACTFCKKRDRVTTRTIKF